MTKQPFFSIVIPTYNRAKFLKAALAICLQQTYKNFEIIVSNNCSTDDTKEVVQSFKDKRIKYYENKKNIGAEPNMRKAISYAKGVYLFTSGDDDFILFENTLEKLKKLIDKKNYGFIRLNLIERKFIGEGIRKSIITEENNIEMKSTTEAEKIIPFFVKIAAGHFAGLVIKNYKNLAKDFMDLPETAWVKIIYKNTKKYGAFFLADYYMIITWSQGDILNHYVLKKGRMMIEDYINFVFSLIPKERLSKYKWNYFRNFIKLQPVIKLYSNNATMITFDKRLLKVEPRLKNNIFFWMSFCLAYITPRSFWKFVRVLQHSNKNTFNNLPNKTKISKKFNTYNKMYYSV